VSKSEIVGCTGLYMAPLAGDGMSVLPLRKGGLFRHGLVEISTVILLGEFNSVPFLFIDHHCGLVAIDPEPRTRFPALPDFLSSSGSGTGSIQPREYK
jgi:hypothetical protein